MVFLSTRARAKVVETPIRPPRIGSQWKGSSCVHETTRPWQLHHLDLEGAEDAYFGSTSEDSTGGVTMTTHQQIANSIEQRYKARRIIISTWMNSRVRFQEVRRCEEKMCYEKNVWTLIELTRFFWLGVVLKLRNIVPSPTTRKMQFEVVIQKIRTNTYTTTTMASSLTFTYLTWVVDTTWGGLIYYKHTTNVACMVKTSCLLIGYYKLAATINTVGF